MKRGTIAIVDYGMGNLRSVEKAFEACGADPIITSKASDIEKAGKIVLPGVGAFTHAMRELRALKLVDPIRKKVLSGTPYFGICLGLQLLFTESEEGQRVRGLNLLPGRVKRFRPSALKIPHMGWNTLKIHKKNCPILKGSTAEDYYYFVHSYFGVPKDAGCILTTTQYGEAFVSSVWKDNIFATQFHPEKSQAAGLRWIKNFIALDPSKEHA